MKGVFLIKGGEDYENSAASGIGIRHLLGGAGHRGGPPLCLSGQRHQSAAAVGAAAEPSYLAYTV